MRDRAFAFDAVRTGIYLYGGSPGDGIPAGKPVLQLRARVVAVRRLRAGDSVSYNATWTAPRETTIATLGIGYADGVRRFLARSRDAHRLLRGPRLPVLGRVTNDPTLVDA